MKTWHMVVIVLCTLPGVVFKLWPWIEDRAWDVVAVPCVGALLLVAFAWWVMWDAKRQ